jgi:demethylmenaquinone methyltransferase/2-methoxy-6-polyprenyl-1,4-benzoquinol methylase
MTDLSHSFGARRVDPEERRRLIRRVFTVVAPRYDVMNDLMSFGIHRLWKRVLAGMARPRAGQLIVDLAGGTGDVARRLAGPDRQVVICDPSTAMMAQARGLAHVQRLAGSGEAIPLADNSADTVTISFGIRNVTHMPAALAEVARVLKPGGRFLCLEFSRPAWWLKPSYDLYSRLVIPRLGALVAGAPEAYRYLIESIGRFPDQREMADLLTEAGFTDVGWRNLSFGIACIHVGVKPD